MTEATADARSAIRQPGTLEVAGLRRVVVALSTVQIISWGCLYYAFAAATSVTSRGVLVIGAVAVARAALALAPDSVGLLVVLGMILGLARGVYTLVQAAAVTDRWGPAAYGTLNGILTAPALVASTVAPFAGAVLAELLGSYADAFLALAGLAAVAAALMLGATPKDPPTRRATA